MIMVAAFHFGELMQASSLGKLLNSAVNNIISDMSDCLQQKVYIELCRAKCLNQEVEII